MNNPLIRFNGYTDEWVQRKLEELFYFRYGDGNKNPSNGGQYPVFGAGDVQGGYTKYNAENSVIIGHMGDAGCVSWGEGKHFVTYNGTITKPKDEIFSSKFGYYLLLNMNLRKYRGGSGLPFLTYDMLNDMETKFPISKIETQRIADYFTNLDNLINLQQQKCENIKKLKKYMLQKMFPKNNEKVPEIRFKGFTNPWEQRKLEDVVEFLDTMRKPLEGAKRISGSYPYYGASGIVDYVDGYLFDEELILLSEDGANITDRNYPVCFLASGKYWVNNHAHVLRTKQGNENNFICNSLERKDYTQYNTGMAMPKLNKETCKKIPISCPEFEEQKKIGDYFRSLDHLITLHQRKCDDLKNLKKYMLQNMFV